MQKESFLLFPFFSSSLQYSLSFQIYLNPVFYMFVLVPVGVANAAVYHALDVVVNEMNKLQKIYQVKNKVSDLTL